MLTAETSEISRFFGESKEVVFFNKLLQRRVGLGPAVVSFVAHHQWGVHVEQPKHRPLPQQCTVPRVGQPKHDKVLSPPGRDELHYLVLSGEGSDVDATAAIALHVRLVWLHIEGDDLEPKVLA